MALDLAILFWCHADPDICEDRIGLLRHHNPDLPIYLLYGNQDRDGTFRERLEPLVDDFHEFDDTVLRRLYGPDYEYGDRGYWKWRHAELLLAEWHDARGRDLEWGTIAVAQWDMLVYQDLRRTLSRMRPDEVLLPGLRRIADIEQRWQFTSPHNPDERQKYLDFLDHAAHRFGYSGEPYAFLSMFMALPRSFVERFAAVERPDLGFIEYSFPAYAEIFETPRCTDHPLHPWWNLDEPDGWSTLRTVRWPISPLTMVVNLLRPRGARLFHPYYQPAPRSPGDWLRAVKAEVLD